MKQRFELRIVPDLIERGGGVDRHAQFGPAKVAADLLKHLAQNPRQV